MEVLYSHIPQENEIQEHITSDVLIQGDGPTRAPELKKRALAGRLISSSLSSEVLIEIGDVIDTLTPFVMMERIETHLAANHSGEEHDRLLRCAQTTRIHKNKRIEDYVKRHRALQQQMT